MQSTDALRMIDAQLRYYLHVEPGLLSDLEWAARFNELVWIRDEENKANAQ